MQNKIVAAFRAITMLPENRTTEKLEANLGGFGSFNIVIWATANLIAKEMLKGRQLKLDVANERAIDVDDIARKATKLLMNYGVDASNASLVTAALLYWAGSNVQAGIPNPNRKLGAVTRMAAGAPSGRISTLPTEKLNNKISGFAATLAMYQAMQDEHLAPYNPELLPAGLAGTPVLGHTSIGEDYLFPELAKKLVPIGVKAMLKAYKSVGIKPCRWMASLFASAAALEILHPDAYIGEAYGPLFKTRTPDVCGMAAVEAAGLPEVIHIRGTHEELKTAKVIGDLSLILKDCGQPTVVGMIMFNEICSLIEEGSVLGVGRAGGPTMLPLHHWATHPALVLYLMGKGATTDEMIDIVRKAASYYFQEEDAFVAMNTLAMSARNILPGPVTDVIVRASEPPMTKAIVKRLGWAHDKLAAGGTLQDLVKGIEERHTHVTEQGVEKIMSGLLGRNVEYVRYKNIRPGAGRRKHNLAQKFFAFDGYLDVETKIDGKVYKFDNFLVDWVPKIMLEADEENLPGMEAVCLGVADLLNSGACAVDTMVCVTMATAFGMSPKDAADKVAEYANYILAIPADSVYATAQCTADILKELDGTES